MHSNPARGTAERQMESLLQLKYYKYGCKLIKLKVPLSSNYCLYLTWGNRGVIVG